MLLPWHRADHLAGGLNMPLPADVVVIPGRPGATGRQWADLVGVYSGLRDAGPSLRAVADGIAAVARRRQTAALDIAAT